MKTRRDFLIQSTVALTGLTILPNCIRKGGVAPSDRVNVAVVGVGGRGSKGILALKDNPLANFVAFADVDDVRASATFEEFPDIPRYKDFRKMLDEMDKQIDAVVVATPDHTHHYIAKWCMNMGKHVYVEKPMAHSVAQCRDLMNLEKKNGLACQMGNQGQSGSGMFLLNEWVNMGLLGDIEEVDTWTTHIQQCNRDTEYPKGDIPVPDSLDWDLWLGPTKLRPYNSTRYLPGKWRGWRDFGDGTIGDMGPHILDAPFRVLDLDWPKKIEVESSELFELSFPQSTKMTFTFPSKKTGKDVIVRWYNGPDFPVPRPTDLIAYRGMGGLYGGSIFYGSKSNVMLESHNMKPYFFPISAQREVESKVKESLGKLPDGIPNTHLDDNHNLANAYHYNNWLLACKGEATCNSNFAFSSRVIEAMFLGNIAVQLKCNLDLDPVTKTIIGNEAASEMIGYAPREGWEI